MASWWEDWSGAGLQSLENTSPQRWGGEDKRQIQRKGKGEHRSTAVGAEVLSFDEFQVLSVHAGLAQPCVTAWMVVLYLLSCMFFTAYVTCVSFALLLCFCKLCFQVSI